MDRRQFLLTSTLAGVAASALGGCAMTRSDQGGVLSMVAVPDDIHELQERTFRWFWDTTNARNGLTPDRWPAQSFCSIAAVGFALTCWPIGVERGWITRDQARERTLTTVKFFHDLPQGPEARGNGGYKGFFYHFLDMETGLRFDRTELSTIDTTLLLGGMLFAGQWFSGDHADEVEIRRLVKVIYDRVEWPWAIVRPNRVSMGWHPETQFIAADWSVYNEGMLVLLLALGSTTHPVEADLWGEWTSTYEARSWTDRWGPAHLHFAPLFGHQYSHIWVDYRGIQDAYMRNKSREIGTNFDYFENSRRATYAQQKYGADNPMGWTGYSREVWGLTACDGPGDFKQVINGREREFFSYSARGPGERDDGTISPTAAASSIAFAPEIVIPCIQAMKARYGTGIYTEYGFLDAFNPTLTERTGRLQHGRIVPGVGWVDGDYLGIDQGPIVTMIENHRSGMVWRTMRGEPHIRRGLERAGFTGGWLSA